MLPQIPCSNSILVSVSQMHGRLEVWQLCYSNFMLLMRMSTHRHVKHHCDERTILGCCSHTAQTVCVLQALIVAVLLVLLQPSAFL